MIQKLNEKRKNKKGFTLVEVIVVLVILAILLAIAIPSVTQYINKAKDKEAQLTARNIYLAASVAGAEQLQDPDVKKITVDADFLDEVSALSNVTVTTEMIKVSAAGDSIESVTYGGYEYKGAGTPSSVPSP